mgnify:FL=1
MEVINFEEKADEKLYGVQTLLKELLEIHEKEGIELLTFVYKKKNGQVEYGFSTGNNAEILGLMEFGKAMYIENELYGT